MVAKRFCASIVAALILLMITWFAFSDEVIGGSVYRYVKKDGTVVYTDNPPPGATAAFLESFRDASKEEKSEWEAEEDQEMQKYREDSARQTLREEKIGRAREEYEKAESTLHQYRVSLYQAHTHETPIVLQWTKKVKEQEEVVAQKKKILDELENTP